MPEFKCEQCGKVFDQEASLKQHVSDKHSQKVAEPAQAEQPQHSGDGHKPDHFQKPNVKVNNNIIFAVVAVVIVAGGGFGAYWYVTHSQSNSPDQLSILSSPIGALGSTNIQADFAVYLDSQNITPLDQKYFARNKFVNLENGTGEGYVIHMHATNVPLGFFFRSLGMSYDNNCFNLDNGKEFCNAGDKSLRMFVKHAGGDWAQNKQYHTYVFQNLDKILITYGNDTDEQIKQQENSVTSFAAESQKA